MPCIMEHSFHYGVEEIPLSQAYSELKCPTIYTCYLLDYLKICHTFYSPG